MAEENEEIENQEEEEQPEPKNFLKAEHIAEGLADAIRTSSGASVGFQTLSVEEKEIEELGDILHSY